MPFRFKGFRQLDPLRRRPQGRHGGAALSPERRGGNRFNPKDQLGRRPGEDEHNARAALPADRPRKMLRKGALRGRVGLMINAPNGLHG